MQTWSRDDGVDRVVELILLVTVVVLHFSALHELVHDCILVDHGLAHHVRLPVQQFQAVLGHLADLRDQVLLVAPRSQQYLARPSHLPVCRIVVGFELRDILGHGLLIGVHLRIQIPITVNGCVHVLCFVRDEEVLRFLLRSLDSRLPRLLVI